MNHILTLETTGGLKNLSLQIEPEALLILKSVDHFLNAGQIEAYLVGGFVRDMLTGRPTADIDVAVAEDVLKIAPEMADALGGKFVLLDEANRIARIVLPRKDIIPSPVLGKSGDRLNSPLPGGETGELKPWYVDLSTFDGTIHQDLARRDFTINAMAIRLKTFLENPAAFQLIDPFAGQEDLSRKAVKAVNDSVFEADPARLLRAVRLAAELDFRITARTEALIRRYRSLIGRVAGERIKDELLRILAIPEAGRFVCYLDNLELLTAVIPEMESCRGVEQPKEHHWDVLNHSLKTVQTVDFLLRQGNWEHVPADVLDAVPWSDKLSRHFAAKVGNISNHAVLIKLAALLHDIAKPETRITVDERVRFYGHAEQGAALAAGILERLRFSNKEIKLVELMVRYHLRPTQMGREGMPTQRAIYRYFRDTGSAGIDIIFLSLADHLAARGPDLDREQWKWHTEQANYILTECSRKESLISPPKLIDGHDLMDLFGLKPGPQIREILEAVKESQAAGELSTREAALSYVKNRLLYRERNIKE